MKKRTAGLCALLLALVLTLAACGGLKNTGSYGESEDKNTVSGGAPGDMAAPGSTEQWDQESWDGVVEDAVRPQTSLAEKIIYSADISLETVDFDGAVAGVEALLTKYGAFLESSSVSGRSLTDTYYDRAVYRRAEFVIRVPVGAFRDMTAAVEGVGNVTSRHTYTENITERYYDTKSRLDAYRVEQERLMTMLEKCSTVSEMLEIESRLSDVRYQLEALESTLRNWQNQVDYSTVRVTVNEVREYTKVAEARRTYWQQIGDGLRDTLENIGDFFKALFKWLVVNLPVLLLIAAFLAVIAVLLLALRRRARARRAPAPRREDDTAGDE